MTQPDLFVVCKNCGSEVSPYVTECPYCGQRVRKRAPKLDRPGAKPKARKRRRLPRVRADEIEGIAPDTRPTVTWVLIALSLIASLVLATDEVLLTDVGAVYVSFDEDVWRWFASPLLHDNLAYQFVTLMAVAVFGTMIERRFGFVAVVVVFFAAGAAGCGLAITADVPPLLTDDPIYPVIGANGAALGLLFAWLVDDRLAARRASDRDNDMIGTLVFAVVLALLPLAVTEASVVAGAGGAATGALLGPLLRLFTLR